MRMFHKQSRSQRTSSAQGRDAPRGIEGVLAHRSSVHRRRPRQSLARAGLCLSAATLATGCWSASAGALIAQHGPAAKLSVSVKVLPTIGQTPGESVNPSRIVENASIQLPIRPGGFATTLGFNLSQIADQQPGVPRFVGSTGIAPNPWMCFPPGWKHPKQVRVKVFYIGSNPENTWVSVRGIPNC